MAATPPSGLLKEPGRIERVMLKWFAREATVSAITELAPRFRRIALAGEALKAVAWIPGQKIQIQFGGFMQRTFTPVSWSAEAGLTEIIVFLHGDAPASAWANRLSPGSQCVIFGPRASLDLAHTDVPVLLFGDETSFGLARSLRATSSSPNADLLFEANSAEQSRAALAALGILDAVLVEREMGDGHFTRLEEVLAHTLEDRRPAKIVLTGKAGSIQRLSRFLKDRGVASAAIKAKAYWAPGKAGLD